MRKHSTLGRLAISALAVPIFATSLLVAQPASAQPGPGVPPGTEDKLERDVCRVYDRICYGPTRDIAKGGDNGVCDESITNVAREVRWPGTFHAFSHGKIACIDAKIVSGRSRMVLKEYNSATHKWETKKTAAWKPLPKAASVSRPVETRCHSRASKPRVYKSFFSFEYTYKTTKGKTRTVPEQTIDTVMPAYISCF